jgi:energy-coupling factor transporter ATP-binding protein EcfA2
MNVLGLIYEWSKGLHAWQRDALRRALEKGTLSDDDVEDLRALVKAEAGISDTKKRTAVPLTEKHVPVGPASGQRLVLRAIENLQNVNAIANGQGLEFSQQGLTVIYGDNASGKSGYVRVMKRACRARDQDEAVLPNVFSSSTRVGVPSAEFRIDDQIEERVERWQEGRMSSGALSAISVFDTRCARVYIDKESDVAYMPYGLDLLVELARVSQVLREKLSQEILANSVDVEVFNHLLGETKVGALVGDLSERTDPKYVDELATLSVKEQTRHKELRRAIREGDPSAKIATLTRLERRLGRLDEAANTLRNALSDKALDRIHQQYKDWAAARKAAEIAKEKAFDAPKLLPGTGGDEWKDLFQAAKRFSETVAYPGKLFPVTQANARCVLCQQELLDGADRMKAFQEFIERDVEKVLENRTKERAETKAILDNLDAGDGLIDEETINEIHATSASVGDVVKAFRNSMEMRLVAAKKTLANGEERDRAGAIPNVSNAIAELRPNVEEHIKDLQKLLRADERKQIEDEFAELEARIKLEKDKEGLKRAIKKLQLLALLEDALRRVSTTGISKKVTELNEIAITKGLEAKLNEEFASLGAHRIKMKLERRTAKGKTLHKLRLQLNVPRDVPLSAVLSEGEQRAIALGSFLAEVNLGGGSSGLIFDDPVSSLDHTRREFVARRLIKESEARQVIIFTHDLYFLFLLLDIAGKTAVPCTAQSINAWGGEIGIVRADVPFRGKSVRERIGELRARHQAAEKAFRTKNQSGYEAMIRDGYERLRESWERAVEEVLFAGVVQRFRQGLESQMLHSVAVEDEDYKEVFEAISRCSRFTHDQAVIANPPVPEPTEFLQDVQRLEQFRSKVEERKKEIFARRKALVTARRGSQ